MEPTNKIDIVDVRGHIVSAIFYAEASSWLITAFPGEMDTGVWEDSRSDVIDSAWAYAQGIFDDSLGSGIIKGLVTPDAFLDLAKEIECLNH